MSVTAARSTLWNRLPAAARQLRRHKRDMDRLVRKIRNLTRSRWLLLTPVLGLALRERWRPWCRVMRNKTSGSVVLTFGGLLLAASVVVQGGRRGKLP